VSRNVPILSVLMTITVMLMTTVAVAFAAQDEGGRGQKKVTICHKGHTITVGAPAADAHLIHHDGDTEGACSTDAETTAEETTAEETTAEETTAEETTAGETTAEETTAEETTAEETTAEETTAPDEGSTAEQVTLCHKGTETITVDVSAEQAHLDHGDTEGTCEESGVIDDTIPKKPLPNTGGIAILGPALGLLLISGAAAGLLVRRR
jgi:LPXTG-motif cell wall-anchored protein